jgi:tRNA A-37 threonylcarbamoyl transferase component Bud32
MAIRETSKGARFVIARHEPLLERLGLTTLELVRRFQGELIKNHRGRRDVVRIAPKAGADTPVLFLKRTLRPYRKDGLASLLRRGRVWSMAREEWENSLALERAGFRVARPVAYGEQCGLLWERFSFILTEAADGARTVHDFLKTWSDSALRRRVVDELAREIRRLHDAGFASPDLFARHFFLELDGAIKFCLIDMARLDRSRPVSQRRRARDLAALNVSVPLACASAAERLRFLRVYLGEANHRALFTAIRSRSEQLLKRRKFQRTFHPAS